MSDRSGRTKCDGLIADFPFGPDRTSPPSEGKSRAVTFNPVSHVAVVPEDKIETKAYSREDIRRFQQTLLLDVHRLRRELASTPPGEIDHDRLYDCVGLERFVSRALQIRTTAAMRAHVDAVLEEQSLQEQRGCSDEKVLASVSRSSSAWARNSAEQRAAGYLRLQE